MAAMRTHDPLARLLLLGALVAGLLTAIALVLAEAVHRRGMGEPAPTHSGKG
jgi:hypothetical protein